MALIPAPRLNPALVEYLTEDARANLAVALLCSLTRQAGLDIILASLAQIEVYAAELYRTELEKED